MGGLIESIDHIHNKDAQSDILNFGFHLLKRNILDNIGEKYTQVHDGDWKVWFSGKIDKKSGHVISVRIDGVSLPIESGEQMIED